ncbi:circumsporozoite protein, partial [Stigmatella aurantiaca DW4/3-1]
MRVDSSPRPLPSTASTPSSKPTDGAPPKGNVIDKTQPETKTSKQFGDDIFLDNRKNGKDPGKAQSKADQKDGRQVSDSNITSGQVEGNESRNYVSIEKDVAEFKTGTGFSKDGTGAQFEASALEAQGDAGYYVNPATGVKGQAGAEANLVSLRGDAGVGKDLGELG